MQMQNVRRKPTMGREYLLYSHFNSGIVRERISNRISMMFNSVTNIRYAIHSKYHLFHAMIFVEFEIFVNALIYTAHSNRRPHWLWINMSILSWIQILIFDPHSIQFIARNSADVWDFWLVFMFYLYVLSQLTIQKTYRGFNKIPIEHSKL